VISEYKLLFGLITCLIGFFFSSHRNPLALLLVFGALFILIWSLFTSSFVSSILAGAYLIAFLLSHAIRIFFSTIMEMRALSSEIFFVFLYTSRIIRVKIIKENIVFEYRPSEK